jgi:pyrroloquinoline quinone biosynthesis protein E
VTADDAFRPYTLVAELTYRCPLRCAYCSNPVGYEPTHGDLDTDTWKRVLSDAENLGVVQVHFSGGEPLLRDDLESLVAGARELGLYTNLITSAVGLTKPRLEGLSSAGLDAVQISIQGTAESDAERIAGRACLGEKLDAARAVRSVGLPLTINVVLHRENIEDVPALVTMASDLGASRLELANTQYLGWALENRDALLPSRGQIERAREHATRAREEYEGRMEILFVLPDYYSGVPRACMDGWGRRYVVVSPDGFVLPCHLAHTLPGLSFENVRGQPLERLWRHGSGMNAFRGEAWMPAPCRDCDRRSLDFGGCRCQAYHLAGNAGLTDPACRLSPHHGLVTKAAVNADASGDGPEQARGKARTHLVTLRYRTFRHGGLP